MRLAWRCKVSGVQQKELAGWGMNTVRGDATTVQDLECWVVDGFLQQLKLLGCSEI
jgi:hypothetical protein